MRDPAFPFDDATKPAHPYVKGARLTVQSHIAPPPTPWISNGCLMKKPEREELEKFGSVERCLRHPPLPGRLGTFIVELEVVDLIRVGDYHHSQVFTVNALTAPPGLEPGSGFDPWPLDKKLVAKVYDPLYFNNDGGCYDPYKFSDRNYTHEVRAYDVLSDFQGNLIPRFFGSYTLDIDCPQFKTYRSVRLILLEFIEGQTMRQVELSEYSQETRKHIMKTVVDFESIVYHNNILLSDLAPRNVMLVPPGAMSQDSSATWDIVFIDFEGAIFGRKRDDPLRFEPQLFLGQYISPLLRWKDDRPIEFKEWIDWEWPSWIEAEFAHTAGTITDEMRARYCE